jgi:hypothetical protein
LVFSKKLGTDLRVFAFKEVRAGTLTVQAGRIHGVEEGTEFALQDRSSEPLARKDLGHLVTVSVDADSSTLRPKEGEDEFPIAEKGKVLVSDWRKPEKILKVFIEQDFEQQLQSVLSQPDEGTLTPKQHFVQS